MNALPIPVPDTPARWMAARHDAAECLPAPNEALQGLLDAIDYGTLVVDAQLRVTYANRTGRRWLEHETGLQVRDGRLRCADPTVARSVHRAVEAALTHRRRGLVDIAGVTVAVVPCSGTAADAFAALLIQRRGVCSLMTAAAFARQHELSPAETAVLQALSDGLSPEEIARRHGVALCTVRTQVQSIREKTGLRSTRELITRLSIIPPVLPVVDDGWRADAGLR